MEVIRTQFKTDNESPEDRKRHDLERNAAEDHESANVKTVSMKKRRGRPRKDAAVVRKTPSLERSHSSSPDSQVISKRRLRRLPGGGRLQVLASLGTLSFRVSIPFIGFSFSLSVTRCRREIRA